MKMNSKISLVNMKVEEDILYLEDEEEDIELEELEIQKGFSPGKGDEQHASLLSKRTQADSSDSPIES